MKNFFRKYVLFLLALLMLAFAIFQVVEAQRTLPQPDPPLPPPRTPFGRTIAGAGIVEAETENIAVGTPLPGIIAEVYVPVSMVGKIVKIGDPLFRIDTRHLRAQLEFQQVNVELAEAQQKRLAMQPRAEEIAPLKAAVQAAQSNLDVQEDNVKRFTDLRVSHGVSEREWKQSIILKELAFHQLAQARAKLELLEAGAWQYDRDIAAANVHLAEVQLKQTEIELERALVRAPIDGQVLRVNVRPGEYVGAPASQALIVLGGVANLHVRVDIDEQDIPRAIHYLNAGKPALASPRGDPTIKFPLSFVRIEPLVIPKRSLTGDSTERVNTRVLQVIYRVERGDPALYVGMQVNVFLNGDSGARAP